jgi:hypothetical protein
MSRRDYHDWWYYLEEGDVTLKRVLVDRKGSPSIGNQFIDKDGERWVIWYVEEGPRVRNARLEREFTPPQPSHP